MSKEYLEALKYVNGKIADLEDDLQHYTMVDRDKCREFFIREDLKQFTNVQQALNELKAIKEANPSEALMSLHWMGEHRIEFNEFLAPIKDISEYNTIKQALLKAQEQEKVLEILKNKLEFVFFGRTREVKIEQDDDSDNYVYLMNGFDDSTLPDEEFDLLKRWLG